MRHYAKRALTPWKVDVKLGCRCMSHMGRAGWLASILSYDNCVSALIGAFSMIVKTYCETDGSLQTQLGPRPNNLQQIHHPPPPPPFLCPDQVSASPLSFAS